MADEKSVSEGEKKFLGIDLGTTSLKAAVFDANGRRLGLYKEDYELACSEEGKIVEFDANKYFEIVERAIKDLTGKCGRIDALSVDTQGETIILTDSGASSSLWAQIKADVTGKCLRVPEESETACLGAAIIAAAGEGTFASIQTAASGFTSCKKEYVPGSSDYSEAFKRFGKLDKQLN